MSSSLPGRTLPTHSPTLGEAPAMRLPRVLAAYVLGGLGWSLPFLSSTAVFVPARLEGLDPSTKVEHFATLTVAGSLVALVSNVVFGALSDLTRSRLGQRKPWVLGGAAACSVMYVLLSSASSFGQILVIWCLLQLALNAYLAAIVASVADGVSPARRGVVSSVYGTATILGQAVGSIVGSMFLTSTGTGLLAVAPLPLIGGVLFAILFPTLQGSPRAGRLSVRRLLGAFALPRNAADFYWALVGRFILILGYFMVLNYQLYILSDHLHLDTAETARTISLIGVVGLVTSVAGGLVAGPLSDRLQRRKALVIGASVLIGVAVLLPYLFPTAWAMVAFAAVGGVGLGVYLGIDVALVIDVLPNEASRAKDLGILNMANTGGQIFGPGLAGLLIAATGGYSLLFLVSAALCGVAALMIKPIRSAR